jgi:hypothetical protein
MSLRIGVVFVMACFLAGFLARVEAGQSAGTVQIKSDDIGGVVTGSRGPEAGVWVIAETTELPTKYVKIVVTDEKGRYLLPELPKATYKIWVRGYGLVDSTPVQAMPGKLLDLKAVIAPTPKDAAQYYPADYWYSLIKVPDKSEFPMKPTPAPASAGAQTAVDPTGAKPGIVPAAQQQGGVRMSNQQGSPNEEISPLPRGNMANQEQWIDTMKQGCQLCHQLGDWATRDLTHLARYNFKSSEEAWATRIHFGQAGNAMSGMLGRYVDQERAIKMFADWTDRITSGELPPSPERPQGVERNVVITMWDWGNVSGHPHDAISTDRRHPTMNANGLVYAADYNNDALLTLDPVRNVAGSIDIPTREDKADMRPTWSQTVSVPSPFWGKELALGKGVEGPHNPMFDQDGRVWVTSDIRPPDNPDFCKQGSDLPFAKYFPMATAAKHLAIYDPKTKKFTLVDTCFSTHHLQFAEDKDNTAFFSGPGGQSVGWVNSRIFAETGDEKKAQGWCPAYLDTNGDGKIDPAVDKRIPVNSYGIILNPIDGSVWMATTGPTPGHLLRVTLGSNPPATCMAEVYEPPFNNPKMPGVFAYAPRGINVDRNGVIWTALSGSSQLAGFDRRKCKATNGTGQQCPEGWTLYTTPGPKMKGVTDDSSADFEYYNWVDQFNTLGLGDNIPIVNGTSSDSLEAFLPSTKTWVVMRVPYPMGFYSRGLDGRIDEPNAGWKGRGVWATYGEDMSWHTEGGPGTVSKAVKFQIRPNPLTD